MITLNDYLYDGDTIFRILQKYIDDLKKSAKENQNEIDRIHSHFLIQIRELLEHNDFLTAQSRKSVNFINIWQRNIHILLLLLREESNL